MKLSDKSAVKYMLIRAQLEYIETIDPKTKVSMFSINRPGNPTFVFDIDGHLIDTINE
jgi:hypothetical protein